MVEITLDVVRDIKRIVSVAYLPENFQKPGQLLQKEDELRQRLWREKWWLDFRVILNEQEEAYRTLRVMHDGDNPPDALVYTLARHLGFLGGGHKDSKGLVHEPCTSWELTQSPLCVPYPMATLRQRMFQVGDRVKVHSPHPDWKGVTGRVEKIDGDHALVTFAFKTGERGQSIGLHLLRAAPRGTSVWERLDAAL